MLYAPPTNGSGARSSGVPHIQELIAELPAPNGVTAFHPGDPLGYSIVGRTFEFTVPGGTVPIAPAE